MRYQTHNTGREEEDQRYCTGDEWPDEEERIERKGEREREIETRIKSHRLSTSF